MKHSFLITVFAFASLAGLSVLASSAQPDATAATAEGATTVLVESIEASNH